MKIRILSAGAVVVRWDESWRYLLLRAYQYWDFPKGGKEKGESPMQAALREVEEETGITDLNFRWGERYFETGPYARGKVARYYLAETKTEDVVMGISPELGRPEHHEYRWMNYDEAWQLCAPRVRRVLRWSRKMMKLDLEQDKGRQTPGERKTAS